MTPEGRSRVYGWRVRVVHDDVPRAQDAVTHWTPEEPDQPACDADVAANAPAVMFGTLNPDRVTCRACQAITKEDPDATTPAPVPVLPVVVTVPAAHRLARTPEALVTPDALPYLPSLAAWHRLTGWWRRRRRG